MRELLTIRRNRICLVMLILVYVISTYFYNTSGDVGVIIKYSKMVWSSLFDGTFFNYYQYAFDNMINGTVPNYNYFIYLFFAICLLPVYLINWISGGAMDIVGEILIVNTFLLFFVILSGYLVYRLSKVMGLNKSKACEVFFVEQTSILLIFGSVGFCQFDIVYVDIVLLALIFCCKKHYVIFSLIMSVAIMLKTLPIIIFIPLILIFEKRIIKILEYLIMGMSLWIVYGLVVRLDDGYDMVNSLSGQSLNFMGRIFPQNVSLSWGHISFFVIAFVVLCFYAYDKQVDKNGIIRGIILVPIAVYGAFLITVAWHPQWLVILAPFMSMAIVVDSSRRSLPWVDAILGIGIVIMVGVGLKGQVDNYMINNGIIGLINSYEGVTIGEIVLDKFEYASEFLLSLVIASMLYFVITVWWDLNKKIDFDNINSITYDKTYATGIFVRPIFLIIYPIALLTFNIVVA